MSTDNTEKRCECYVCQLGRKVAAVTAKLSPEDRDVIEELQNYAASESMDAGRNHAFLMGWWPGAKPIPVPTVKCDHEWCGAGEAPKKWTCGCGTLVYRSYEDYCMD